MGHKVLLPVDGDVVNIKIFAFRSDYKSGVYHLCAGKLRTAAAKNCFDLPRKCSRNDSNSKRNLNAYNV